jgi:hypothetical protein
MLRSIPTMAPTNAFTMTSSENSDVLAKSEVIVDRELRLVIG